MRSNLESNLVILNINEIKVQNLDNIKWRFDNKGIGSDQNILKRKIKEALKSPEGRNIIENLTSGPDLGKIRTKDYFYDIDINGISNNKVDKWVDDNFNAIFKY